MSSFFTRPASQKKRKRQDGPSSAPKRRNTSSAPLKSSQKAAARDTNNDDDVSISGSDSEDNDARRSGGESEDGSSANEGETAAERRLKLAERYLENVKAEVAEGQEVGFDAEEIDRELIAARLKEDVAEDKGRVYRYIAAELDFESATQSFFRVDSLASTGVAVCEPYVYTASKDMTLVKWELAQPVRDMVMEKSSGLKANGVVKKTKPVRRKPTKLLQSRGNKNQASNPNYDHHSAAILAIAASADGKFLATGGADKRLIIWDPATLKPLKVFTQHRDAVTGLAFRGKTNQLFSASKDRTLKVWSLNELAYVETLFGHQDEVVDVAAVGGSEERCVSVGARDRTARLWKVVEESQLVFRGGGGGGDKPGRGEQRPNGRTHAHEHANETKEDARSNARLGSLDRLTQLDTQLFVTGADNGSLSLFSLHKKKPLHSFHQAHGLDPPLTAAQASAELHPRADMDVRGGSPRWITALASVPYSDLVVSGSWDGAVRCWRIGPGSGESGNGLRKFELVGVLGRVNSAAPVIAGDEDVESIASEAGDSSLDGSGAGQTTIRGIVNDLKVFERGDRGKDGICVVAAVGNEPRLGRWMKIKGAKKNGAVVFEIPRKKLAKASGINGEVNGHLTEENGV